MIVICAPGQGSQTPGFLAPWLELPGVREQLEELSAASEVDLILHGTKSDADTIRDTKIAQPLIVAASIISARELARRAEEKGGTAASALAEAGTAGHSVGEFAAANFAGVLSPTAALRLVGVRGRAMADAASKVETGMAAVVGGREEDVLAAIAAAELAPANINGGGQIVAAGKLGGISALQEAAPRGSRVIPLQVAGAFHTEFMLSAVPTVAAAAAEVTPADPTRPLWTNYDGSLIASGSVFAEHLVQQIARPVRWDKCMEAMQEAGISGLIELAPAGALTGIAKRALRGVPAVSIKTPEDLDAAVELLTA